MKSQFMISIVLAGLIVLTNVAEVHSCTCVDVPPPPLAYWNADVILLGRVQSFLPDTTLRLRVARVEVQQIWKGKIENSKTIYTQPNGLICGYDFEVDSTYLIYAYYLPSNLLYTSICTRTRPISEAAEDLAFLSTASFYPLAVGNLWRFDYGIQETVTDSVRIDGKLYHRLDHFLGFLNALLRLNEEGKLFLLSDASEQLWVDFNAEVGATWELYDPYHLAEWTVKLESRTDTVEVPAGTFHNCYRFYFRFHGDDNDWVEWYALNIGPVKRDNLGFAFITYPLESARINGMDIPTSVPHEPQQPARSFSLHQNHPNPFVLKESQRTVIHYSVNQSGQVRLNIYDLLGRKIRTLVQQQQPAGEHASFWDGNDADGQPMPNGVYFYRLEVNNEAMVRKLVLAR